MREEALTDLQTPRETFDFVLVSAGIQYRSVVSKLRGRHVQRPVKKVLCRGTRWRGGGAL